jgi:hypothetical protein
VTYSFLTIFSTNFIPRIRAIPKAAEDPKMRSIVEWIVPQVLPKHIR